MDREKAADLLDNLIGMIEDSGGRDYDTALKMGVEALTSKPTDCISRQTAIDALGDEPEVWTGKDEYAQGLNNQWHYDRNAIKALPSTQPEQQWIPCSERLPAYGEDVLISIGGYCCNVGHIVSVNEEERYNWYFSGWYHLPNDVDAWMPLPEPYKEKDNEKA